MHIDDIDYAALMAFYLEKADQIVGGPDEQSDIASLCIEAYKHGYKECEDFHDIREDT